jgi:hypothetical protein
MKHPLSSRRMMLLAATCLLVQHSAVALADGTAGKDAAPPAVGARPALDSMTPQPPSGATSAADASPDAPPNGAQGDVAELMRMLQDSKLVELRTTYNGSYGASLLYYPQEMTYYAVLFRDKHFWRVIKSQDDTRAQMIYSNFAQQTSELAQVEIRRTELQAQNDFIARVIAISEERAQRLQADLDVARTQQAKVNDQQRAMQAEAVSLRQQKEQAQAQLREVQRQVQQLQRQTEVGLPPSR